MNEFIKKLIERFEEYPHGKYSDDYGKGFSAAINAAIKTVTQVAEEYKTEIEFAQKCVELAEKMSVCDLIAENARLSQKLIFLEANAPVIAWQPLPAPYQPKGE